MKLLAIILLFISSYSIGQNLVKEKKYDNWYVSQEIGLVLLQTVDIGLTIKGLDNGATELNPMYRKISPLGMIGVKASGTVISILLTRHVYNHHDKQGAKMILLVVNLLMSAVVANNAVVVLRM